MPDSTVPMITEIAKIINKYKAVDANSLKCAGIKILAIKDEIKSIFMELPMLKEQGRFLNCPESLLRESLSIQGE